ncbi:MAG: hypothetical protein PVH21_12515 [Myxococcales bacterium]
MRKRRAAQWLWVVVAAVATFELAAGLWIRTTVPAESSWKAASELVRARFRSADRIVAAPGWIDPIVRFHLGDLLTLHSAAPSDLAGFERIWELSIRGASTRDAPPDFEARFGRVQARMWRISSDAVGYDFVEHVDQAQVEWVYDHEPRACPWRETPGGRGGLGRGPMAPKRRFVCDPERPWLWVGATVLADRTLTPRRCVWQHPAGPDPVRVTFFEVPLSDRLVVHGGIDYEHERWERGSPVTLQIWISDRLAGELVHRDGDGWSELEIDTSDFASDRATVRFETTTQDPAARVFCWSASTRARGVKRE